MMDRAASVTFLAQAYAPDDWIAVLLKPSTCGRVIQRIRPVSAIAASGFQAWLRAENTAGANVYVSANAFVPDQRTRRREAVQHVRHVLVDVDDRADDVLKAIASRDDIPVPSYVLRTSPDRAHVLWRVTRFTSVMAEALQKQLAATLPTDPAATASTQLTRLPGFLNHKYTPASLVTIAYINPRGRRRIGEFPPIAISTTAPTRRAFATTRRSLDRARRYADSVPPAIAGGHGDLQTFRLCCRIARGFGLSDDDALAVLCEWNHRCLPPWSERELLEKLRHARRYGRESIGGLLEGPS